MAWFMCPDCGRDVEAQVRDHQSAGWSRRCTECQEAFELEQAGEVEREIATEVQHDNLRNNSR